MSATAAKVKALVFDLGGVLLNWDRNKASTLSSGQFLNIMNSTAWHDLDRGHISLELACIEFSKILSLNARIIVKSLEEAQLSLTVNTSLVQTIHELQASNMNLKFYVMSNISKEHFQIVRGLNLPWDVFELAFASGVEGMRKPDLCSFEYLVKKSGFTPDQMLMIDDTVENICAARSIGMHGMLVDNQFVRSGGALKNMFLDPGSRAMAFLRSRAGKHHCTVEGHGDVVLKDNFAQLLIWELTGDANVVYLRWPSGKVTGHRGNASREVNGISLDRKDIKNGLWNYFSEAPVLTTVEFPPDADTTSTAYLSLPSEYLDDVADANIVLHAMAENVDRDGIMQTYFTNERPRTTPEVCCNILRMFHKFGRASDPRIVKTERWVVDCLRNRACLDGNRHYSTSETFLYFVSRLYAICSTPLKAELEIIQNELENRLNMPINPLGLAFRLAACQFAGIEPALYQRDLERLLSLQEEDGGWPAGHFCCMGRTGARIGNRGLTTALALKIIKHEKEKAR
ncbi:HAD-like protein [Xylaria bambusicola]|uniref:HAD-like protein n=1 Tax=Xylaria bambusicola TaxID=326684 RepID=UPI002008BD41|nr:HAD-like protein [Xylaria bambusicola]KAI0516724.1 HAD-like protein [Xylaria bambusicola]